MGPKHCIYVIWRYVDGAVGTKVCSKLEPWATSVLGPICSHEVLNFQTGKLTSTPVTCMDSFDLADVSQHQMVFWRFEKSAECLGSIVATQEGEFLSLCLALAGPVYSPDYLKEIWTLVGDNVCMMLEGEELDVESIDIAGLLEKREFPVYMNLCDRVIVRAQCQEMLDGEALQYEGYLMARQAGL